MKSDPTDILLAHDDWATRSILDACTKLTEAQFHERFDIGLGSLHDTITHIIGAMRAWTDALAARPPRPRPEGARHTTDALATMLADAANDLSEQIRAKPLADITTREREGKVWTFTRGAILTHVTTHGMHHRAQCINMLRKLGIDPLPMSSVTDWARTVDMN